MRLGRQGQKPGGMPVFGAAGSKRRVGLLDHRDRIANQYDVGKALPLGQFKRADQRQPFRIAVRAVSQIVKQLDIATHDNGRFDPPGIWAATAIKEYFQPCQLRPAVLRFDPVHADGDLADVDRLFLAVHQIVVAGDVGSAID